MLRRAAFLYAFDRRMVMCSDCAHDQSLAARAVKNLRRVDDPSQKRIGRVSGQQVEKPTHLMMYSKIITSQFK